ncbi:NAD(P)-dependent oxidoreductase [Sphingomonas sp.]|uniref:NAD-dependent epimerase/dehydratase family protein n=1 Tax=Sphingomonas sp. TaxID=28214 RepID=UPI00286BC7DA|nr:NAD(P)-dependent oxidoreductase [Sphingomonas sp.]
MTYALTPHVAQALLANHSRIVITGAGGWLGLATLELFHAALGDQLAGRVVCFGSRHRTLVLIDGTPVEQRPMADIAQLETAPTIVLHLAFLTKDRAEDMDEQAYRAANEALDQILLDALPATGADAIFIASSGAAARADDPAASPAMRLYGALKGDQEARFADWADRHHKRAVIARLFNISGPHINKHGSYALAAFILDALAGRPIAINAPHRVVRGYVAIRELMSLVIALLLDKATGVTSFDSGGDPLEMLDIAQAIADLLGPVAITRPTLDPTISDHYAGDAAVYRDLLASKAIDPVPFARQVIETAEFLNHSGARP